MSISKLPFLFVNDASTLLTEHDLVLAVPKGIQSKADLFLHYEREGRFPAYFGHNWDALMDCLRDFSWASQKRIIITHEDLPLANDGKELQIYLEILETAVNDWKMVREGPFAALPEEMSYVEHELLVLFPSAVESTIVRVLCQN
jgi:hypothetical protein